VRTTKIKFILVRCLAKTLRGNYDVAGVRWSGVDARFAADDGMESAIISGKLWSTLFG
jgi:hypothetical protein